MTRRAPNLTTKLASAIYHLERLRNPGRPFHDDLKVISAKEYLRRFEWDHIVYAVWEGGEHFTNLNPLPIAEHRAKTKRDVKEIAKVRRGLRKRARQKRKSKSIPGSRDTKFRKKLNGAVELRT